MDLVVQFLAFSCRSVLVQDPPSAPDGFGQLMYWCMNMCEQVDEKQFKSMLVKKVLFIRLFTLNSPEPEVISEVVTQIISINRE